MAFGAIIESGEWLPVSDRDPRAVAMHYRHYSYQLAATTPRRRQARYQHGIVGPGRKLVLMTSDASALFAWLAPFDEYADGQPGARCTIFQNESTVLSSQLIREADEIAFTRWPDIGRHYTWVSPTHIQSVNPGYCFQRAGWSRTDVVSSRGLKLLELQNHVDREVE